MRQAVGKFDFSIIKDTNVEDTWNIIRNLIKISMEEYIPIVPPKDNKTKFSWINKEVIKSAKKKHKLFTRFLQTREGQAYIGSKKLNKNGPAYKMYKKKVNKCNKSIKKARKVYETKIANNCKTNPKSFWKYVHERSKTSASVSALEKGQGEFAVTDGEKAELLTRFLFWCIHQGGYHKFTKFA